MTCKVSRGVVSQRNGLDIIYSQSQRVSVSSRAVVQWLFSQCAGGTPREPLTQSKES